MHALHLRDFRARRYVLDDDDFAVLEDHGIPERQHMVCRWVWRHITHLPDDVSIRTSGGYGDYLRRVVFASWRWGRISLGMSGAGYDPLNDPIGNVVTLCSEEIDGALYNALVGYYRLAFSACRDVLENVVIGTWMKLTNETSLASRWIGGDDLRANEVSFDKACRVLMQHPSFSAVIQPGNSSIGRQLFITQDLPHHEAGLSWRLYRELSNYVHGRPGFAHVDLWKSNGPILSRQQLREWLTATGKTLCLAGFMVAIACPELITSDSAFRKNLIRMFERMLHLVPMGDELENLLIELHNHIDETGGV